MTRVCHMTSAHNSNDTRIFYKECSSLAKAGYDTYLVARGDSREENGVHVVGLGAPPSGRIKRMTVFARKVYTAALALDADIYHIHDPELIPYGQKLLHLGKTVVFDSHEDTLHQMVDKQWIPSSLRPLVNKLYTEYAMHVFPKFDALISVTPNICNELKSFNEKTYQITNYPKLLDDFNSSEKNGEFYLCFAGGIEEIWSHTEIINAMAGVNARYRLCGKADERYIEKLSSLPMWVKVDYLGKVSHEEALSVERQSNVGMALAKPSNNSFCHHGTLGNTKLFEYMMSGIPVICTDFVLWKNIIDKYHCGICVDPDNVDEIEAAIQYLIDNPEEARQMGLNGRRAVEQEFNWAPQEKVLLEMYTLLTSD